jgi:RimJ/RimL family protein N-acetyltransferase
MTPFNLQPVLKSELLILKPLKSEDFDELYAVASDPLIWEQHPASDRYKREVFKEYFNGAMECKGAFAILDAKTGKIIGSSRYQGANVERSDVIIGFTFLARDYWGGPYNRNLKTLMLEHAFKFVDSVLFHVGENNYRSQMAMEKIGGVKIGTINKASFVYQIQKTDFSNLGQDK